jgi:hypothetical protein
MSRSLSEAHKASISRAQIARYQKQREEFGDYFPPQKVCTKCGKMKTRAEYAPRKRALASGEVKEYLAGECRACANLRSARWREQKRKEGVLADMQREWNSRRDKEHRKQYQREYSYMRRRKEGREERGPWKRNRVGERSMERVDRDPFVAWLDTNYPGWPFPDWPLMVGIDEARFRRIKQGRYRDKKGRDRPYNKITIDLVDKITVGLGEPQALQEIYPHLYPH